MTIAALDYGRRRIGLAIADSAGLAVRPLTVVERRSLSRDIQVLRASFASLGVTDVVVGLPLNMDGSIGDAARAVQSFAAQLAEATGLTIHLHDERLTSFEAEELLKADPRGRKKRKEMLDAVAACVILESWLREHKSQH